MFGSLIRRKQTKRPLGEDNVAFEIDDFFPDARRCHGLPSGATTNA